MVAIEVTNNVFNSLQNEINCFNVNNESELNNGPINFGEYIWSRKLSANQKMPHREEVLTSSMDI